MLLIVFSDFRIGSEQTFISETAGCGAECKIWRFVSNCRVGSRLSKQSILQGRGQDEDTFTQCSQTGFIIVMRLLLQLLHPRIGKLVYIPSSWFLICVIMPS